MGEDAVAAGAREEPDKSMEQLMEEMREGARDILEGRVDSDNETIRRKIERFRED